MAALLAAFGASAAVAAEKPPSDCLRVTQQKTTATIGSPRAGPVLEYAFAEVPFKPYVRQMFTPGGVPILRDSPHDHKHHHALMFAVGVEGVDFWSESPSCGVQVHRKFAATGAQPHQGSPAAPCSAFFTEQLDWLKPDKTPLLSEERTIRAFHAGELGASLVTWQTRLEPAEGKPSATLTGSHYFGLGMRLVTSMDKDGTFITPHGEQGDVVRGSERLVPAAWCAYTASADGKLVTVALFDDPQNPRHPARMFTMTSPFAYLSATLNLWKEPWTVKAGEPLVLRYGVAAWDGRIEPAKIEALYRRWVALCSEGKPTAKTQ